jgi:hypothetical protein
MLPGNIYSGDKQRACFTNPTELAFRKGTLDKHYPIEIDGLNFDDAETAYKYYTHEKRDDFEFCKYTCQRVLEYKLNQYPELLKIIKESGGLQWIERCYHYTYARTSRFKRWEGQGRKSAFIDCLYKAYDAVWIEVLEKEKVNI